MHGSDRTKFRRVISALMSAAITLVCIGYVVAELGIGSKRAQNGVIVFPIPTDLVFAGLILALLAGLVTVLEVAHHSLISRRSKSRNV